MAAAAVSDSAGFAASVDTAYFIFTGRIHAGRNNAFAYGVVADKSACTCTAVPAASVVTALFAIAAWNAFTDFCFRIADIAYILARACSAASVVAAGFAVAFGMALACVGSYITAFVFSAHSALSAASVASALFSVTVRRAVGITGI